MQLHLSYFFSVYAFLCLPHFGDDLYFAAFATNNLQCTILFVCLVVVLVVRKKIKDDVTGSSDVNLAAVVCTLYTMHSTAGALRF